MMDSTWAVVGAEVVERYFSWNSTFRYGPTRKIAKVYKNGNFVLEGGGDRQYRVCGDYATRAGGGVYAHTTTSIVPVTQELRAEIARAASYTEAAAVVRKEAERLEKLWRGRDIDETLAEAAKITSRSA